MVGRPIPEETWRSIVRHVPIVSVDLVVCDGDSVVLGRRTNDPAKGEWFVPGGRVRKHERLDKAVHRVATEELGTPVAIDHQLGVYEHRYDVAEFDGINGKHYIAIGYVVTPINDEIKPDDQHDVYRRFTPPFDSINLHPYVEEYLSDAGLLGDVGGESE